MASKSGRWWRNPSRILVAIAGLVFVVVLVLLRNTSSSKNFQERDEDIPVANAASVVLVTTLESGLNEDLVQMITDNRKAYAERHNYAVFMPHVTDYMTHASVNESSSWTKIPAVRHAMTLFPDSSYFFYLDRSALITNADLSLESHILHPARLSSLIIADQPVVPPDSIIHTVRPNDPSHIHLILTQDHEGLSQSSFILRRSPWATFFLDCWYDPLYRSYNFQRVEGHALEHLVQWHSSVLDRLAIVPQTIMNAYVGAQPQTQEQYVEGHFVANIRGCGGEGQAPCEAIMKPYFDVYKKSISPITADS